MPYRRARPDVAGHLGKDVINDHGWPFALETKQLSSHSYVCMLLDVHFSNWER